MIEAISRAMNISNNISTSFILTLHKKLKIKKNDIVYAHKRKNFDKKDMNLLKTLLQIIRAY